MYLNTSSGFLATENTLNTTGSNQYTFGLVSRNVNLINGELYKNTLNGDFNSATQAEGTTNNLLQINCNRYLGDNTFDWTVLSGSLADQGFCSEVAIDATTNIFNECVVADESNVFSLANFEYNSLIGFNPNCVSPTTFVNICTDASGNYADACPQLVTSPCPSCVVALGQQLDFTPPGLERNKIKGELIRMLAQEGDMQQLLSVLTDEGFPEDKKIIIPTRVDRKEFVEARAVLNDLEINTLADQKFADLFDVLITIGETERELKDITPSELAVVQGIAISGTEVAVQAEAVLAELNKTRYIRFPQPLPSNSAIMVADTEPSMLQEQQELNMTVYPNPSEGDVMIELQEARNATTYLIDAMGRIIHTIAFNDREVMYPLKGLANGIYTLSVYYTDGTQEIKRVLIK